MRQNGQKNEDDLFHGFYLMRTCRLDDSEFCHKSETFDMCALNALFSNDDFNYLPPYSPPPSSYTPDLSLSSSFYSQLTTVTFMAPPSTSSLAEAFSSKAPTCTFSIDVLSNFSFDVQSKVFHKVYSIYSQFNIVYLIKLLIF